MSDSYSDSNFASLLSATATAYDERPETSAYYRANSEQPYPEFRNGNRAVSSKPSNEESRNGDHDGPVTSTTIPSQNQSDSNSINQEESNKFAEIQKIIAAELSNFENPKSLNKTNSQDTVEDQEDEGSGDGRKSKKRKTTRYKGVFKCGKKWKAQIQANGVQHYLGLFETEEEAARAYDNHARMILGVMKAKTNFPYNPEEAPLQPLQPVVTFSSPPKQPVPAPKSDNDDDGSKLIGKRSYVGMKLRKLSEKEFPAQRELPTQLPLVPSSSSSSQSYQQQQQQTHNANNNPLIAKATLGQSLVHIPMPLTQNSYVMNNIPASYTAVMHPARFINNEGFNTLVNNPTASSSPLAGSRSQQESNSIDWANHPYTPLEITGTYENDPAYVPLQNHVAEPDWRDQIYYWTGMLNYDDTIQSMTWKGRWLGSFTGKPSIEEFESSSNEFFYTSVMERSKIVVSTSDGITMIQPQSSLYKGYYMMENVTGRGNDMERYHDKEFLLDFEPVSSLESRETTTTQKSKVSFLYNVYGKGDSEFGVFILNGTFDSRTNIMDMCRQYVADTDLRCSMSLPQLKQYFKRLATQINNND